MRIGLTGGIAAGKSTAAARLRALGALHIDYDALARLVVEPGGAALPRIAEAFGSQALHDDGTLDRAWIAEHVFGHAAQPGARERLDAIEHPLIYREAARIEAAHPEARIIVHDVPLLAEVLSKGEIPFTFDHIITVEAPIEERIRRMIVERGMTREQAEDRIRNQSSQTEREAIADIVIDTSQPVEHTRKLIEDLYNQWSV
ncbi:dephospho-CoA kinase [Bifidobacterium oedipodis]|uniref:Dephospho-CoA kinase n=1 Tax=Bifidobacterium oedipodis TaxID=2675322 RepID=A0A7Y0HSE6_9BIFI|nr:dephospho-CoA kinase [Bifidobacterium sp. DSM 109957]NMM93513.1 dephospho-CoA kinase [Bifidobacterium sp. DSM 109957]